jgi:hypothetical protein
MKNRKEPPDMAAMLRCSPRESSDCKWVMGQDGEKGAGVESVRER